MRKRSTGGSSRKPRRATPTSSLRPGGRLGHLRIRRVLGSGAYGTVLLAYDEHVRREVALKVFHAPRQGGHPAAVREELLREARVLGRLPHVNIPTLFGVHELPRGGVALEMEHVEGTPLEDLLEGERPLPEPRVRSVARGVAAALAAAHALGVLHGDVKPSNVICTPDGSSKLVDFGLARVIGPWPGGPADRAGTPPYMPPEVLLGEPATTGSDVWSFGVLLHRMLTGRAPFVAEGLEATFAAVLHAPIPPAPDVAPDLEALRTRCLERRSEARPASGSEVLAVLEGRAPSTSVPRPFAPAPERATDVEGREEAVAAVLETCTGRPGAEAALTLVTGPVGIGKSTVLRAVAARARAAGRTWVEVHVSPIEGLLRPWIAALRPMRSATDPDDAATSPAALQAERLVAELSARAPTVVGIEDLHHATPEEVRVLQRIVRRLGTERVGWLVTERTAELGSSDHGGPAGAPLLALEGARRVALDALSPDATFQVLQRRFPQGTLEGSVAEPIVRRSRGNPLFAVQMFEHLREQGTVRLEGGRWVAPADVQGGATPPALRDLVARRLHALPTAAREVLDAGAVDGQSLEPAALAAALDRHLLEILRGLERLAREGSLVERRNDGYTFEHPLVPEVLYAELPAERRGTLHRRLAQHLAGSPGVDPERLGTHWERAGDLERAVPHLLAAGRRAAVRREVQRAVALARRCALDERLADAEFVREHRGEIVRILTCYTALGLHEERDRGYQRCLDALAGDGQAGPCGEVLVHAAMQRFLGRGLAPDDAAAVREAEPQLASDPDRLRARYLLGLIAKHQGRLGEAESWFDAAIPLAVGEDSAMLGTLVDQRAVVAARRGDLERAVVLHGDAARLCREHGQTTNAAISEVNASLHSIAVGRLTEARATLERAHRTFVLDGQDRQAATVHIYLADLAYSAGELAHARSLSERALEVLDRTSYVLSQVPARRQLAHLCLVGGDLERASDHLLALRALLGRMQDHRDEAYAALLGAQLDAAYGRREPAAAGALRALALAERSGDLRTVADVAVQVGESTFLGVPTVVLTAAVSACPREGPTPDVLVRRAPAILAAIAAAHGRGDKEAIPAAVTAMRSGDLGLRGATLRLLAWRMAFEGADSRDTACRRNWATEALEEAAALGHVWWQVAFHRLLAPLDAHGAHASRAAAVLARTVLSLGAADRAGLMSTWLDGDVRPVATA